MSVSSFSFKFHSEASIVKFPIQLYAFFGQATHKTEITAALKFISKQQILEIRI